MKIYNKLKAVQQQSWTVKGKETHPVITALWQALIEFLYDILKEEFNDV